MKNIKKWIRIRSASILSLPDDEPRLSLFIYLITIDLDITLSINFTFWRLSNLVWISSSALKVLAQAKIFKKIGDFILA